jgi:hypothetical protein
MVKILLIVSGMLLSNPANIDPIVSSPIDRGEVRLCDGCVVVKWMTE